MGQRNADPFMGDMNKPASIPSIYNQFIVIKSIVKIISICYY